MTLLAGARSSPTLQAHPSATLGPLVSTTSHDNKQPLHLGQHGGETVEEPTTNSAKSTSLKAWLRSVNPGLPMMVLNAVTACLISLVVKQLMSPPFSYESMELVFIRSVTLSALGLTWTCGSPFLKHYFRRNVRGEADLARPVITESFADLLFGPANARLLMFGRSVCGFLSVSGTYLALVGLNVGEATVLTFFKPIWVGILGRIILGEPWERLDAVCSVASLLGVVIIASPATFGLEVGPQSAHHHPVPPLVRIMSLLAGTGGSLAAAGVYVFLRKMKGQSISAMQVSTTFAVWSAILSFFATALVKLDLFAVFQHFPPASLWEFTLLIPLMSVMSLANQLLMNLALRYETAAKCAAMNFVQIPAGFLVDLFAYGEVPGMPDYIGGGTIVTCVLIMTLQKLKKETAEAKRKVAAKLAETAKAAKNMASASTSNMLSLKATAPAEPSIVLSPESNDDDGPRQGVYITNTMVSSMVSLRGLWSGFGSRGGSRTSLEGAGQGRKMVDGAEDEQPLMVMRSPTPTAPNDPEQSFASLAPFPKPKSTP